MGSPLAIDQLLTVAIVLNAIVAPAPLSTIVTFAKSPDTYVVCFVVNIKHVTY